MDIPESPAGEASAPRTQRLSDVLRALVRPERDRVALGNVTRALKERGFGALMLLLAAPNLVPLPPGTSTLFGIPLILVAAQLIVGYRKPLLPRAIRSRELSMQTLATIIGKALPWVRRFERLAGPRLWYLPQRQAEQLIGAAAVLMGIILILPIPFGNFLPGVAVVLMSLGLGERDGAWAAAGLAAALASVGFVATVFGAAGLAIVGAL
ncbi:MAG: hypothetical protein BroJett030_19830 [Alphaproteobacteria bacterium]|nr:MAG: hypothetical protein BroJett030_19830 [Alphaproteobacteria bacterium]